MQHLMIHLSKFALLALLMFIGARLVSAQCEAGEVVIEFVIDTDSWGYEVYWELVPSGSACGSAEFIASGGNPNVGCDGVGGSGNAGTTYGNNAIYMEGPFCVASGASLDLVHVDSYGDGGTRFDLYMDGIISGIFNGTGNGNLWTFTAGESLFIDYDVPCAAAEIEIDGAPVTVNSAGGTVQAGEVTPPAAPSGSCGLSGSWCGSDGNATSSVWLTFTPESSDPVTITTCSEVSTFDTQLALYKAEDCGDFATYELVGSNDDACAGYRSIMYTSCLEVGAQYFLQVDGWAGQTGLADVTIFTSGDSDLFADAQVRNVTCPLDKDTPANGFILPFVGQGGSDFACTWTGPGGFSSQDSWIFNLEPGVYTASITTTCGTEFTLARTVNAPNDWEVQTTITQSSCEAAADGAVELAVSGATAPYTFDWTGPNSFTSDSEDLSQLFPGTYQANITDASGCTYPVTAFVPEVEPGDFFIGNDTIICENEPLLIYGPLGYDYEWQDGSNNQFFYVAPGSFAPGTYSIVLSGTTDTGCSFADALILTVHQCAVGVGEVGLAEAVLYPNPTEGNVYFQVGPAGNGWKVFARDVTGRIVATRQWMDAGAPVFNASNWASGQYILTFENEDRVVTRKLTVQNGGAAQ